ncbi:hypothetical protein CsSME_00033868 [Camellia sinensis var. sinensis]
MTPFDFVVLTGLDDMGEWEAAWIYLLGARPPTPEEITQYTRGFLMGNTVGLYLLSALVDLSQVSHYGWGGAGLATLYYYMSATSRGRGNIVGGYWRAWELWVFAYFPTLAPELEVETPLMTPYSLVFEGQYRPRARETLPYLRQFFDTVRPTEITWQPWVPLGGDLRFQLAGGWVASRYRILFEGPVVPPVDMRTTRRLTPQEVTSAMLGTDVLLHLEEGEYATYRHTYSMPLLTGIRTPMRRSTDRTSSSRARAATSSRVTRGYGSIAARDWYGELSEAVRNWVDLAGFETFCTGISRYPASRTLMGALVERWWDTTNSFHFSAAGDMTMTPFDFAVLMGLDFRGTELETSEEIAQYARRFLMFLFGTTLFTDRGNTYDWGGASLATLYCYMSATSRGRGNIVGGYWRSWELWVFAYFPTLAPELEVEAFLMTPYSLVFEGQYRSRPRETLPYLLQYFDIVRVTEPWAPLGGDLRFQFTRGWATSRYRILFEGPVGRAWFLGDRFLRQTMGFPEPSVPSAPLDDMRLADRLTPQGVIDGRLGTNALLYLEDGEYATYRHTYLMPLLTSVHTPSRRSTGMPSSVRTRARDIPSASRAGTSSGGAGLVPPIPPTYHYAGWPDIPTELTGWRYGSSYPIPIEPSMPDHRYVSDPDSPPVSTQRVHGGDARIGGLTRGYGLAERGAAVHHGCLGTLYTSDTHHIYVLYLHTSTPCSFLSVHLIYIFWLMHSNCTLPFQMPPIYTGPQDGPSGPSGGAGPSRPSQVAGRGESSRGRGRRRAHIIEEEEFAHRQSETSAGREDDSESSSEGGGDAEEDFEDGGSDSDSGADGDGTEAVLGKRTKRASFSYA